MESLIPASQESYAQAASDASRGELHTSPLNFPSVAVQEHGSDCHCLEVLQQSVGSVCQGPSGEGNEISGNI